MYLRQHLRKFRRILTSWVLSKVWHTLECGTIVPHDEADLTTEDLVNLVQQTVFLVEQTNNTIYH